MIKNIVNDIAKLNIKMQEEMKIMNIKDAFMECAAYRTASHKIEEFISDKFFGEAEWKLNFF